MRGALVNDEHHLRILPEEQQCNRFDGVWNLGNDQVDDIHCKSLSMHFEYCLTLYFIIDLNLALIMLIILEKKKNRNV